jgi:hypothetical protein
VAVKVSLDNLIASVKGCDKFKITDLSLYTIKDEKVIPLIIKFKFTNDKGETKDFDYAISYFTKEKRLGKLIVNIYAYDNLTKENILISTTYKVSNSSFSGVITKGDKKYKEFHNNDLQSYINNLLNAYI